MRVLKQVHLEKNKRIAPHAYLTLPDWDGMSASWPGEVQTVSITVTDVGQFPVTYVRSLSRGSSLLYVGVYYKQEDQPRNTKNNLETRRTTSRTKEREREKKFAHKKRTQQVNSTFLPMTTHFAFLLLLLPFITHGKHVNLRGAILQDEPKSTSRDLFQVVLLHCLSYEQAMGWFGGSADIQCTSNTACTNPGEKCLVENNGFKFYCGDPITWDQDFPLCD
jgi:hypothetical protein